MFDNYIEFCDSMLKGLLVIIVGVSVFLFAIYLAVHYVWAQVTIIILLVLAASAFVGQLLELGKMKD